MWLPAATNAELIAQSEAVQALHVSATLHAGVAQASAEHFLLCETYHLRVTWYHSARLDRYCLCDQSVREKA
jgi:hypothetical protein